MSKSNTIRNVFVKPRVLVDLEGVKVLVNLEGATVEVRLNSGVVEDGDGDLRIGGLRAELEVGVLE